MYNYRDIAGSEQKDCDCPQNQGEEGKLMVYITEVLNVPDATLAVMTVLLLVLRAFDAFNDPIMGLVVDNTRSRFGKFKPWILVGALLGGVSMRNCPRLTTNSPAK